MCSCDAVLHRLFNASTSFAVIVEGGARYLFRASTTDSRMMWVKYLSIAQVKCNAGGRGFISLFAPELYPMTPSWCLPDVMSAVHVPASPRTMNDDDNAEIVACVTDLSGEKRVCNLEDASLSPEISAVLGNVNSARDLACAIDERAIVHPDQLPLWRRITGQAPTMSASSFGVIEGVSINEIDFMRALKKWSREGMNLDDVAKSPLLASQFMMALSDSRDLETMHLFMALSRGKCDIGALKSRYSESTCLPDEAWSTVSSITAAASTALAKALEGWSEHDANASELIYLGNGFSPRWYGKGETVVVEGEPVKGLKVLVSGELELEGRGKSLGTLKPGEWMGETSLVCCIFTHLANGSHMLE